MTDSQNNLLRYSDRADKSFGLAGMAISLMVWDAESRLSYIDIDASPEEAMRMSPDFYLSPVASAKAVWDNNLRRFQLASAMLVANVTCRHFVHQKRRVLPSDVDDQIRTAVIDEGATLCQLEPEEALGVYSKAFSYCHRLFSHPEVARMASELSAVISDRGRLSAGEVFEILAPLNRL